MEVLQEQRRLVVGFQVLREVGHPLGEIRLGAGQLETFQRFEEVDLVDLDLLPQAGAKDAVMK